MPIGGKDSLGFPVRRENDEGASLDFFDQLAEVGPAFPDRNRNSLHRQKFAHNSLTAQVLSPLETASAIAWFEMD